MSIKTHTNYTFEYYERKHDTDHIFPLAFDPAEGPEYIYISENGLRAVLGFLVVDDSPCDPFTEFDEGEFYQFHYDNTKPSLDDFKRIIRANPGRVFTIDPCGYGFIVGAGPFTVQDTKSSRKRGTPSDCVAEYALDTADGYYIAPADCTDMTKYANDSIEQYSAYLKGNVYGVIVWEYTRASISSPWELANRDSECWGFYGRRYAKEELQAEFNGIVNDNNPCFILEVC